MPLCIKISTVSNWKATSKTTNVIIWNQLWLSCRCMQIIMIIVWLFRGSREGTPVGNCLFVKTVNPVIIAHPPCQHLLGLICQNGVVSFDHDSKCGCDSCFQQPIHPFLYEILLVLERGNAIFWAREQCAQWATGFQDVFVEFEEDSRDLFSSSIFYLGMLLRHMLFWELGKLNQLR